MSGARLRTLVLGFDALSFEYLDAFELPNFAALRRRGVEAPLASTFPPWTASAWPSMYTGVPPDHHGVYGFFDFDGGPVPEALLADRNDVDAPAVWNYLSADDEPAVVLNVPMTHPAEPVDGALVPGYLAPESAPGAPAGVRETLADELGEPYRIYAADETGPADDALLEDYCDLVDLRARAGRALLAAEDPTVAVLQVQRTDSVFHKFDDRAAFRRVYRAADAFLGDVLDAVADDVNVVVCSDHGMGPTTGYNVYVNELLRRAGLVTATTAGHSPTLGDSKSELVHGDDDTDDGDAGPSLPARLVSGVADALARAGVRPADVYGAADRLGLGEALQGLLPDDAGAAVSRHVDWERSTAYCRSGPELGVRVNVAGRDHGGVVAPDEREAVVDAVVELLADARTPDGEPAFDWVRPREAVYDGPRDGAACDVLFEPAGMNNIVATNLPGRAYLPIDKHNHKRTGVLLAAGPDVDASWAPSTPSLTDVAPTVLALADRPVPERMTGEVPEGLVEGPVRRREYGAVEYGTGRAAGEDVDDAVEARLEDLGYR